MKPYRLLILCACCCATLQGGAQKILSLAGSWQVKPDPENTGVQQQWYRQNFERPIQLPGTLDDAAMGKSPGLSPDELKKDLLLNLTRNHSYIGAAWYAPPDCSTRIPPS
ncbi:hypothetical protein V9K67_25875 [Paraflavisolibacter sp. H34]|uniref:hypothetical protein n=1 Tax=Huijunlia imazamoxiresistens TaxID=3127457 RepID=UPI00301A313A